MLRDPQHERIMINSTPFVTSINSVQALSASKDSERIFSKLRGPSRY